MEPQSIISEIHRNIISQVVQIDGKTQTIVSTYGKIAARARFGNLWHFVQITAGGSITIPTRKHLNLEKLTALAWYMSPGSGRPLAKQEVLLRQHSGPQNKTSYSSECDQVSCDLSGRCTSTHSTHSVHILITAHHLFSVACNASLSDFFCCCHFLSMISRCREETEWKQAHTWRVDWRAEHYITVASHPFWFVIHFAENNAPFYTRNTFFNIVLTTED